MLQVPYAPPKEYTITLEAERIAGNDGLNIGIVVGGGQTMVVTDGWDKHANALNLVGRRTGDDNETTQIAAVFTTGQRTTIECTVRRKAVAVSYNGQPLIQWSGDPRRLSLDRRFWFGAAPGKLFLGAWGSSFRITRMELVPLSPNKPRAR